MKLILHAIALSCLLATSALVSAEDASASRGGFRLPSDPEIPVKVREASRGVFRIVTLLPEPVTVSVEALEKTLSAEGDDFMNAWLRKLIKAAKGKQQKTINLHFTTSATAYLLGDQKTLISSRHTLDGAIADMDLFTATTTDYVSRRADLSSLKAATKKYLGATTARFYLMDHNGKIVFDPRNEKDVAFFDFFMTAEHVAEYDRLTPNRDRLFNLINGSDFVVYRLNRPLEGYPGLKLASSAAKDETVFLLGFPTKKEGGKEAGKDSDGFSLYVTEGSLLGVGDHLLSHDAASAGGSSGGPLVNGEGEVVGMHSLTHIGSKSQGPCSHALSTFPRWFKNYVK